MLTLLGILTGLAGPLATIAGKIADTKLALAQAQTDQERNKLQAEIAELQARQAAVTAEAGQRINGIIRGLLAFGPMLYLTKIFVFDKVLGSFFGQARGGSIWNTDPLDDNLWKVVVAVVAFYFLYDITARFRK